MAFDMEDDGTGGLKVVKSNKRSTTHYINVWRADAGAPSGRSKLATVYLDSSRPDDAKIIAFCSPNTDPQKGRLRTPDQAQANLTAFMATTTCDLKESTRDKTESTVVLPAESGAEPEASVVEEQVNLG